MRDIMNVCRDGFFFFQAEDGIRDLVRSRGLGDVYKRQVLEGDTVCKGMQTHFLNETGYSCRWDFGDGGTSLSLIHI